MAENSHLAFYKIVIHEKYKKDKKLVLSNIEGKDLFQIILTNLRTAQTKVSSSFRFTLDLPGEAYKIKGKNVVYGFCEKGKTGYRGTIKNTVDLTDEALHRKLDYETDSITKNLFYLIYIPEGQNYGLLLSERLGRSGLSTSFKSLLSIWTEHKYTVDLEKVYPKEIMNEFVNNGSIKKFVLKKHNLPKGDIMSRNTGLIGEEKGSFEIHFIPEKKGFFKKGEKLEKYLDDLDVSFYSTNLFTKFGFDDNEHEKRLILDYKGNSKTISLNNPYEETANINIEDEIKVLRGLTDKEKKRRGYYKVFKQYLEILTKQDFS